MAEYIEREALLAAYDKAHVGPPGGARQLMEDAPAADVAPVVHGRCERESVDEWYTWPYACMECGTKMMLCDTEWNHVAPKVCANCGALMDKDGE